MADADVEKVFQDFWANIVMRDGQLDLEQVKKELFDFHQLIRNVSLVYCEVTNHAVSKPLTDPQVVISLFNDYVQECVDEAAREEKDIVQGCLT